MTVTGDSSIVTGDSSTVTGDSSTVTGDSSTVTGDSSTFMNSIEEAYKELYTYVAGQAYHTTQISIYYIHNHVRGHLYGVIIYDHHMYADTSIL